MKRMLNLSAALLLVAAVFPTLALAQDLSADLSGATARQEGFASLVGQGNAVRLTALTNGIGTPTRAVIRRGGADVVELDAEFNFGLATGTTSGGPVAAILADPASYQLRVEGPDGVIEGPIVGVASAAGVIVDPLRRNFGNVPVGTNSEPRRIFVTNTADQPYRVTLVGIFGPNRAQYRILGDECSGTNLAPNQRCIVTFRFVPAAAGLQKALLVVRTNDPAHLETHVQLRGDGV